MTGRDPETQHTLNWLASGVAAGAVAGGIEGSAAGGPGFVFTLEQLRAIAARWERLAERFRWAQRNADIIVRAEGPGADYASQDNAAMIRESGEALLETLKAREAYCLDQWEKTRAAMDAYATAEDEAAAEVNKPAGGRF
ncbi:hypothetical protein [Amycolatopsis cihanbeyliensis]|uniref:Excreted virulence factor EspC (Type VII ESX diderm) n=1 Tax=Amycolatopsis cihanbeyliensis TaxID=1128664 RepID=A0A542DPL4_AMYCI|nr:hypothetical protein [Amycolatopsis cihanbeyliensis]TQJ04924.1 hypothetical protein FB471_4734 [Amycolatopsis cihanbeyliensis]